MTDALRAVFAPQIGAMLTGLRTAELLFDGAWSDWPDLPARLAFGSAVVSLAWSRFDRLHVGEGETLPFDIGESVVRWKARPDLPGLIGERLNAVSIAQGDLNGVPIWTRVLLRFGPTTLEVYNALDETGLRTIQGGPKGHILPVL
ncbi:hypothetical protein [Tropicibacter sp. S64]|uniref:hypothetical protein n=1 Tax=Tropicibacter sp. S64 TaxID=3415122 RepID=UPI003C7CF01E